MVVRAAAGARRGRRHAPSRLRDARVNAARARRGLLIGADGFMLPLEVALDVLAGFARRGRGKTHTGSVWAEELYREGVPFAIIDVKGDWWGLRSNRAGDGPGIAVTILGGEHGDLPLRPEHGALVADLLVDHPGFYLLDLSDFPTAGSRFRFLGEFAIRLYDRKKKQRDPLHIIVDEAHTVFPQQIPKIAGDPDGRFAALSVGAWHNIAKLGRQRGLGLSMWDQRPASVNKNDSSQAGVQAFGGITSSHDRKAIRETLVDQADDDVVRAVMASLPTLPRGTWKVWITEDSYEGLPSGLYTVQIRDRETFDSSATPKIGERRVEPKVLAAVDLAALREQMSEVVEAVEANDPDRLRKRIDALEEELARARAEKPEPRTVDVLVPVPDEQAVAALREATGSVYTSTLALLDAARVVGDALATMGEQVPDRPALAAVAPTPAAPPSHPRAARPESPAAPSPPPAPPADQDAALGPGGQRIVGTLARYHPLRLTEKQLGVLAKLKVGAGGWNKEWAKVRDAGYADRQGGAVGLTAAGVAYVGVVERAPHTREEVVAMWRDSLPSGSQRMLDALLARDGQTHAELGEAVAMTPGGGGYNKSLSLLRNNDLVESRERRLWLGSALRIAEAS